MFLEKFRKFGTILVVSQNRAQTENTARATTKLKLSQNWDKTESKLSQNWVKNELKVSQNRVKTELKMS